MKNPRARARWGGVQMGRPTKVVEKIKELRSSDQFNDLKSYLLGQLTKNGNNVPVYRELVDEYMELWITVKLLSDDINEKGIKIRWRNGKSQSGYKRNESISEKIKATQQMLQILDKIGISPENCGDPDDKDDPNL